MAFKMRVVTTTVLPVSCAAFMPQNTKTQFAKGRENATGRVSSSGRVWAPSDSDDFDERMRTRNGLAVLAKVLDVEFNRFANELLHFRAILADGHTAR
jgi:hypothetical protein